MPAPLIELTARIVSAHAATRAMTRDELLTAMKDVHTTLKTLEEGTAVVAEQPDAVENVPVLSAKRSIQKQQIVCLICGKEGYKTLTRHLKQAHGMKPAAYRRQFGLPAGTPLVAKAYSAARREAALKNNLGEKLAKGRVAYQAKQKKAASKKAATTKKTS
jgi:predicted transcriptional regulator